MIVLNVVLMMVPMEFKGLIQMQMERYGYTMEVEEFDDLLSREKGKEIWR